MAIIGTLLTLALQIYIFIIVIQVGLSWLVAFDIVNEKKLWRSRAPECSAHCDTTLQTTITTVTLLLVETIHDKTSMI